MKNLKRKVIGLVGVIAGFGLIFSFAVDIRQLKTDLSNAIQHFEKVKVVSSENQTAAKIQYVGGGLLGIDTDNIVLSQINSTPAKIGNGTGLSILGGKGNEIGNNSYSAIIGGENNSISTNYSTIIGGSDNAIDNGQYGTILGGRENVLNGASSTIIGGSNNEVIGKQSVSIGKDGIVEGDDSVGMGSDFGIKGKNSFVWNAGDDNIEVGENVFVVNGKHGMVINTGKAYSFAKLTVGGPIVIGDNNTTLNCNWDTRGVLILKKNNAGVRCFCSCNGEDRSSIVGGQCEGVCGKKVVPECGSEVHKIGSVPPYSYSGSCEKGEVVEGTGAYIVGKNDIIYRSCQSVDGAVIPCAGVLPEEERGRGDNRSFECWGDRPQQAVVSDGKPTNGATWYTFASDGDLTKPCMYICIGGYTYVSRFGDCRQNEEAACSEEHGKCTSGLPGPETELDDRYTWNCEGIGNPTINCFSCKDGYNKSGNDCLKGDTIFKAGLNDILTRDVAKNEAIKHFTRAHSIPNGVTTVNISTSSVSRIDAWYSNTDQTIYYYADADTIYLNSNSYGMFADMIHLVDIDTEGWDTSKVTSMSHMFAGCSSLQTLNLDNWDTRNVRNMDTMFMGCNSLTNLSLHGWVLSGNSSAVQMFAGCSSLTSLDLSSWNISNFKGPMNSMFNGCSSLTSLDLSSWNTSKVTHMHEMFNGCSNLHRIYTSPSFTVAHLLGPIENNTTTAMFWGCNSLEGGAGTHYLGDNPGNRTTSDGTHAHIDGGGSNPGYFTSKS